MDSTIDKKRDNSRHLRALELDKVLGMLCELAACADAKMLAKKIQPAETVTDARRLMANTADANALSTRFGTPSISGVKPCADSIGRAKVGASLSMRELLDVSYILRAARSLVSWRRQAENVDDSLGHLFEQLSGNRPLEDDIARCILSEEELADDASPELSDIRRKINRANLRVREQLDKMIRSTTYQKYLQEQIVTIRSGRFVVPVKAEHKNEIKGIVHDTSSSGSTMFIEPMGVVEANNEIRELQSKERNEISRILLELSGRVGASGDSILSDYDGVISLDLIFAKSRLADKMRAFAPEIIENGETVLRRARHPLIGQEKIVPIDINIGGEFDTLVITGPNTGGKTVALKTLGLLTLMAMCGLMIPVSDGSRICFYRSVLADIGDEQSIEQSLSTFSGHMTNIISILTQADDSSLVLIDELGAGTDPVEGAALAVAIIARLRDSGAKVAATTHYAEIKMFALQTAGVENASCEFDVATLRPTYRLLIGVPGRSNAFAISERLGLPVAVIEAAKAHISSEDTVFEDVVSGLEQSRQALEHERGLAERYRKEADEANARAIAKQEAIEAAAEKEIAAAREKARSIIEQVKFQSAQLLDELDDLKKQKDRADFGSTVSDVKSTFRAYMKDLENMANPVEKKKKSAYRLPRALRQGDAVLLAEYGTQGTVLEAVDASGYVRVQAGILKTRVKQENLQLVDEADKKVTFKGGSVSTRGAVAGAKENASSSVDLRGMDSAEAIIELDRYIDNCLLSGIKSVTIIHGKGSGVLRTAVTGHLRRHRSVREHRAGAYGEGDSGVTVAELK